MTIENATEKPSGSSIEPLGSVGLDRKCRNGDTGRDLYRRLREIEDRLVELRKRAQSIKALLLPIEESIEIESMNRLNVETRINVWRQEQNDQAWRRLRTYQRLRRGDQWRNGSGRWVPVQEYNWGCPVPDLGARSQYRRRMPNGKLTFGADGR